MTLDDNEPRPKPTAHPGESLYDLSVGELKERIALYTSEIARLEKEIAAKEGHMKAADSLFKL